MKQYILRNKFSSAAIMGTAVVEVDLDALFKTTTVQVINAIDAGSLKETLRWILEKLGEKSRPDPPQSGDVMKQLASLADENAELRSRLAELQQGQVGEISASRSPSHPSYAGWAP